jgi:hypothetical protein
VADRHETGGLLSGLRFPAQQAVRTCWIQAETDLTWSYLSRNRRTTALE